MSKGKLLVISGFSGVGKGTVLDCLKSKYNNYKISVSATTRQPRNEEVHGVNYYYISKEEFEEMINNNQLLEHALYLDNYYGTPRKFVEEQLSNGINVILEIEIKGALQIKKIMPESYLIFILPPSAEELKSRLVGRNTESAEKIFERLAKAAEEAQYIDNYDYYVINENNKTEQCADNINKIVTDTNPELVDDKFVEKIKHDVKMFVEGE